MGMATSTDGGYHWTPHKSTFPPIGGGHREVMIRLGSIAENPLMMCSYAEEAMALPSECPPETGAFIVSEGVNAVPTGSRSTQASLAACEATCVGTCNQFSWNTGSHHCYTSEATVVNWKANVKMKLVS